MKKVFWLVVTAIALMIITLFCAYYFSAFNQINNLFKSANSGVNNEFMGTTVVSKEDYMRLQSVDYVEQDMDYYVNGGTVIGIKKLGLSDIVFSCTSNYTVIDVQTGKSIQVTNNQTAIVTMKFNDFKWQITLVE